MYNIILLNAPPRSGKDTVAEYISEKYGYTHLKFSDGLIEDTSKHHGINLDVFIDYYNNRKDDMVYNDGIGGFITPREMVINYAENIVKKNNGDDYFASMLVDKIENGTNDCYIISDFGFDIELTTMIKSFDCDELTVLKIVRDGCDYSRDSRIDLKTIDVISTITISNDKDIDDLYDVVDNFINLL